MSDFDSTDFDSESSHTHQQPTPSNKTPSQPGNFDYPPYITYSSVKTTFQQNEMSYKQKVINLIYREQFTTMQSGYSTRPVQTYKPTQSRDVEIQAPISEPRSGFNLIMQILANNNEQAESSTQTDQKSLRHFTHLDCKINLLHVDFPVQTQTPCSTFTYQDSTNTISQFLSHQTKLIVTQNNIQFIFPNHYIITDIALSLNQLFASTTCGKVLILSIPDMNYTYSQSSNAYLTQIAAVQNSALTLSPDGTLRKWTLGAFEIIDKNSQFTSLCSCRNWCFLGFQAETGICSDFEQIRSKSMKMISGRVEKCEEVENGIKLQFNDKHFEIWSGDLEICHNVGYE